MRLSSKVIGTSLAVVLFAVVLCPLPGRSKQAATGVIELKQLLAKLLQSAAPAVRTANTKSAPSASQPVGMSVGWNIAGPGDFAAGDSDTGPSVNFEWRNADHVLATAQELGLRVIAAGPAGILGEVARKGQSATLVPVEGSLNSYSKITRVLPSDFFGSEIAHAAAQPVSEYLVLLPPGVEKAIAELVRLAVAHEGKPISSISGVRGELTAVNAQPSFKITRVFERS